MKRALLVGIDDYAKCSPLHGCVNDVLALQPLVERNHDGTPNFSCVALTRLSPSSPPVTRDALLQHLDRLLAPGADSALLFFAGHGAADTDDLSLCTYDATDGTPGVKLSEVLAKVKQSTIREIVIILDCCFSGAAGGVPQLGAGGSYLRPGLAILTASRGDQTAAETPDGRGAFSTFLCGALDGGAADTLGKVTGAGLYAYLDECFGAWDQRPMFKANLDRLSELRACEPSVPLEVLRNLTEWFPRSDFEYPLDPSYEPDADPENADHEAIFAGLQKCRSAKLVEPVGEEHLYYAAINSTGCRLTPLGRLYWRIAREGRL